MFGLNVIVMILIVIGALNWGLIGFFNYNLVGMILGGSVEGSYTMYERIAYAVVGLAGLWGLSFLCRAKALCGCEKEDKNGKGSCCRK